MASACAVLSIRRAECWGKAKLVGGVPVDLAKGGWDGGRAALLQNCTQVSCELEPQACDSFGDLTDGHLWQGHHLHTVMATTQVQTLWESLRLTGRTGDVTTEFCFPLVAFLDFMGAGRVRDTRRSNNHRARSEENLHQTLRTLLLGLNINILVSFIPERERDGVLY